LATPLQELRSEFYDGVELANERFELVRREKLDPVTIAAHAGVLVVRPVKFYQNRTFDLATNGCLAVVIEAFDVDDETVLDLVAWPLERPHQFATALGRARGLGLQCVLNPASYFGGKPLQVHQTPLAWLKAGCEGVVILREESAFSWLAAARGNLAAANFDHGRELARLLYPFFDLSRILIPREEAPRSSQR
jgi:hypothetical protein